MASNLYNLYKIDGSDVDSGHDPISVTFETCDQFVRNAGHGEQVFWTRTCIGGSDEAWQAFYASNLGLDEPLPAFIAIRTDLDK